MVENTTITIATYGYLLACLAYSAFLVRLFVARAHRSQPVVLMLACLGTALWAANVVFSLWTGRELFISPYAMEVLQSAGWAVFLWSLLWSRAEAWTKQWVTLITLVIAILTLGSLTAESFDAAGPSLALISRILLVVASLVLLENLLRNTEQQERWRIKFLVIGLGSLFVFDLFYYAQILSLATLDLRQFEARGWAYAVAAILVWISARRSEFWTTDIILSRRVAFFSTTILIAGASILAISATAYFIGHFWW